MASPGSSLCERVRRCQAANQGLLITKPREYLARQFGSRVATDYSARLLWPQVAYSTALIVGALYLAVLVASLVVRDVETAGRVGGVVASSDAKVTRLLRIVLLWVWAAAMLAAAAVDRSWRMPFRSSATRNLGKMLILAAAVCALAVWETVLWALDLRAEKQEPRKPAADVPIEAFIAIAAAIELAGFFFVVTRGVGGRGAAQYLHDVGTALRDQQSAGRPIFSLETLAAADREPPVQDSATRIMSPSPAASAASSAASLASTAEATQDTTPASLTTLPSAASLIEVQPGGGEIGAEEEAEGSDYQAAVNSAAFTSGSPSAE